MWRERVGAGLRPGLPGEARTGRPLRARRGRWHLSTDPSRPRAVSSMASEAGGGEGRRPLPLAVLSRIRDLGVTCE